MAFAGKMPPYRREPPVGRAGRGLPRALTDSVNRNQVRRITITDPRPRKGPSGIHTIFDIIFKKLGHAPHSHPMRTTTQQNTVVNHDASKYSRSYFPIDRAGCELLDITEVIAGSTAPENPARNYAHKTNGPSGTSTNQGEIPDSASPAHSDFSHSGARRYSLHSPTPARRAHGGNRLSSTAGYAALETDDRDRRGGRPMTLYKIG